MENISIFKEHCCGCGECANICKLSAIKMVKNKQGFLFPKVNNAKCINCGKCVEHCTFNKPIDVLSYSQQYYACINKNELVQLKSRSGGVFTSISDYILQNNGVVYGCELINFRRAAHTRATSKIERDKFRGSKYIQSDISKIYNQIYDDVASKKFVLFSGTPCQVRAIKNYCKDLDCQKLILVDIVCHGVCSDYIWSDYLNLYHKKVVGVDFRNKIDFDWDTHYETIYFKGDKKVNSEIYKNLFFSHLNLRESCFNCPYKNLNRIGDLTIGDCWGIKENYNYFYDKKGVSLVLINSNKGQSIFEQICKNMNYIPVDIKLLMQPSLYENFAKPIEYNDFWDKYRKNKLKDIIKKEDLSKIIKHNKVKVATLTFNRAYNHGAILQCYALQKKLNDLGIESEVIDYYPQYFFDAYLRKNFKYRDMGDKTLKSKIKYLLIKLFLKIRTKKFETFIKNKINLSENKYKSIDDFKNINYEKIILGSDQVWAENCTHFDPVYFLSFINDKYKKLTYSVSFGIDYIDEHSISIYKNNLGNFANYSIRESSGVKIIKQLFNIKAEQSCDPTLLIEKKDWKNIEKKTRVPKKYILIYFVNLCNDLLETATKLSKIKNNIKIVCATSNTSNNEMLGRNIIHAGGINKSYCGPDNLIYLVNHADYVITDSYHGVLLSLIFHKQFLSNAIQHNNIYNHRIYDLLCILKCYGRLSLDNLNNIDKNIDWQAIDKKIANYRNKSTDYLRKLIKNN